jgi:long-subunit acyl-CoA synthetase (AMP-forming)
MQRLAIENRLNSLEQVRDHFRIIDKIFEVGEVLTPTMKLRRPVAREMFSNLINEMYAETDNLMNA